MKEIIIKPLRKDKESILSDVEYHAKLNTRQSSSAFLSSKKLKDGLESFKSDKNLLEQFTTTKFSFNTKRFGDYVCNVLKTTIVSDEKGRIGDILLTVPPGEKIDESDERHLLSLIKLMHDENENRHFTMLCHANHLPVVKSWFDKLGIHESKYSLNISIFQYSIWAQDAYVALKDELNNPIICEGVHFPRYDDATIADDISMQTNNSAMQSYLFFQGGNILEVGEYVLVGKDYIVENLGRAFLETEERVIASFEKLFGKKVLPIGRQSVIPEDHRAFLGGGYYQPIFHIDMYITPTGKLTGEGKEIVLVGSPKLGRDAVGENSKLTDYDVYFDEVADQLSRFFEVKRLPILPSFIKYYTKAPQTDERYYYLSYNNALVENYEDRSNVYLPSFSQDVEVYLNDSSIITYEGTLAKRSALDKKAKEVWESLGFVVHQMDGLEDLAIGWGSVHCITKTLVRTNKSGDA
ncbi:MAG: hypothetical protein IPN13_02460 [Bacteroidetes bacterium]|nr:hypothetical protein [Bacteroidota bacterium]